MLTLAEFCSTALHEAYQLDKECSTYQKADLENGRKLVGTDYSIKMQYRSDNAGEITLRYTFNNDPQWTSDDNRYFTLFLSAVLQPQVPLFQLNKETYKKVQNLITKPLSNGIFVNFKAHSVEAPNAYTFYANKAVPFNASLTFQMLQEDILDFIVGTSVLKKTISHIFGDQHESIMAKESAATPLPTLITDNFKELGETALNRLQHMRRIATSPYVTYEANTFNYTISTYQFNFRACEIVMDTAKKVELFVGTLTPFMMIAEESKETFEQFVKDYQSKAQGLLPKEGPRNFLVIPTCAAPSSSAYTIIAAHQFEPQLWTAEQLSATALEFFKSTLIS